MLDNWDNGIGRYSIIDPSSYSLFALHCSLSGQSSTSLHQLEDLESISHGVVFGRANEIHMEGRISISVLISQATVDDGDKLLIPAAPILWVAYKSTGSSRDRQILRGRLAIMTQRVHACRNMNLVICQSDRLVLVIWRTSLLPQIDSHSFCLSPSAI